MPDAPFKYERCSVTMPDGDEQCLFTGPHSDHIAKGPDGQIWIDRDRVGKWRLLGAPPSFEDRLVDAVTEVLTLGKTTLTNGDIELEIDFRG